MDDQPSDEHSQIDDAETEYQPSGDLPRYEHMLRIRADDLRGKRVLDVGCGDGGFVKDLIGRGITREAYGIDINIDSQVDTDDGEQGGKVAHLIHADCKDRFPIQNMDFISSLAAISLAVRPGYGDEEIRRILHNVIEALAVGGEARITPIQEAVNSSELPGLAETFNIWKALLAETGSFQLPNARVSMTLEYIDEVEMGDDCDRVRSYVLVVRKTPLSHTGANHI